MRAFGRRINDYFFDIDEDDEGIDVLSCFIFYGYCAIAILFSVVFFTAAVLK